MALYWQEVRKISTRKQIRECVLEMTDVQTNMRMRIKLPIRAAPGVVLLFFGESTFRINKLRAHYSRFSAGGSEPAADLVLPALR